MLGLRKYKATALDLWCGEIKNFTADLVSDQLSEALEKTSQMSRGHLAYLPTKKDFDDAGQFMTAIQQALDQTPVRRLTLVVAELEQHQILQTALFAHFPE